MVSSMGKQVGVTEEGTIVILPQLDNDRLLDCSIFTFLFIKFSLWVRHRAPQAKSLKNIRCTLTLPHTIRQEGALLTNLTDSSLSTRRAFCRFSPTALGKRQARKKKRPRHADADDQYQAPG